MMTPELIFQREHTRIHPLVEETTSLEKSALFDLPYLSLLSVQGTHNKEFLQGQLSCDVREVEQHQMRPGALCNLQGRIVTLLDVVQQHETLHLILPRDMRDRTQRLLEKPAALSRVTLKPLDDHQLFGFYLAKAEHATPFNWTLPTELYSACIYDQGYCYCVAEKTYILVVASAYCDALVKITNEHHAYVGSLAWHALRLRQRHVDIYPESRGLFLPHRLDLHQTPYLSFNKGCYKGQEIIARMHYRATQKHALMLFQVKTHEPLTVGLKLFAEPGQTEIGELVDMCPLNDDTALLAISILIAHPNVGYFDGHTTATELKTR